jgi:hypothetical protein
VIGHASTRENVHADHLAGKSTVESGQSLDLSDILQAIKEASSVNDSSRTKRL